MVSRSRGAWFLIARHPLALPALALLMATGPSTGATEPAAAPLVVTATVEGEPDLFLVDATGSITRLTDAAGADNWAAWSPDGKALAFQSQRDGNYELYTMDADGSNQRNLSRNPGHDGLGVWSPDGSEIAFFSSRGFLVEERSPIPGHIYRLSLAGGEPERLTAKPLASTLGPSSWSPDGKSLLLTRTVGGEAHSSLLRLDLATGAETRLTDGQVTSGGGLYSPDGGSIAYYEEREDSAAVVLIDASGGNRRPLLDGPGWHYPYAWAPDGSNLSVTSIDGQGAYSVLSVALDGTATAIDLPASLTQEREASWRP